MANDIIETRRLRLWQITLMVICLAFFTQFAKAQVGNEFWFVAPEVSSSHSDNPIALRITAMDKNVTVTISMPANPGLGTITKTINAFQQVTVNINESFFTLNNVENRPNNTILNKGLLITSTGGDISAYYEVSSGNNPDIFTLKGQSAVGTEFYVPGQNSFTNHDYSSNRPYERVDVVATEDNTVVTIVPSINILGGGTAGTPITVTLSKGQTYGIVAADWSTATSTLAGTKITANNNIAVTISDDSIEQYPGKANAWDLIGDQIVPTSIIGTEYVAIRTTNISGAINKVYILATEDNTSVSIDGNAAVGMSKGQIKQIDIVNDAAYIKSSKGIYVYQVSGLLNTNNWQTLSNEMGSALLPTIKCTGSKFVSFTRNFKYDYWVQIMTQGKSMGKFKMMDAGVENSTFSAYLNNSSNWKAVANSGVGGDMWYTTTIPMSSAPFSISTGRVYSVENTSGLFHLGVLDMNNISLSYGYYSSYSNVKIEGPSQTCVGEKVILESKYSGGTINWVSSITGDTILSTSPTLEVTKPAIYWVKLDNQFGCVATDSLDVKFNKPVFNLATPGTVCPNEPVTFTLPSQYTYVWEYLGNKTTGSSITITPTKGQTIDLSVTATDVQGCATKDTVVVISFADDQVDLVDVQAQVCVGDTIKNLTQMANYEWKVNGVVVPNYNKPYILATVSGTYELTGTTINNCESKDSKTVTVNPLPVVNIAGQTVCANTPVIYNGPAGMSTYLWNNGTTGSSYTANAPGLVSLQVKNSNGCVARDTATVIWRAPVSVQLSYQTTTIASTAAPDNISTCPENTVTLTAPSGFSNYKWTVGGVVTQGPALTSMSVPLTSGAQKTVVLEVTDAFGCTASDNTKVIAYTSPTLTVDKAAYCVDETMTAGIMNSYEWSYNGAVIANSNVKTYKATQAGTYTVRSWDSNGCVSQSINITANALPLPSITSPTVCASEPNISTGLPATGVTYKWSQESTAINGSTNYTSQTFSVPPVNTNKVWLEVTNVNGCKAKASAIPSWYTLPTVDISYFNDFLNTTITANDINLCPNKQVVLNGTAVSSVGITTYKWYINGNLVAGNNTNSLNVTTPPSAQTTIKLEVIDSNGCMASDQVVLKVFADPASILTMPNDICLGSALSVESIRSSLDRHVWTLVNNTKDSLYTFTPALGGVYKLDVWDKNGCWATENYTVVDPAVTLTDNPTTVAECANTPHVFTIVGANTANFDYIWNDGSTGTSLNATVQGDYWVEARHKTLGCYDREDATLTWYPDKLIDLGKKLSVCNSATLPTVVVGSALPEFQNWKWYINGVVIPGETSNTYSISKGSGNATYTATADYVMGAKTCPLSQPFDYEELPTVLDPIVIDKSALCDPSKPDIICLCEGEEIEIAANNGFNSYQWYEVIGGVDNELGGETGQSLKISSSGTYKLVGTQPNECESDGTITVNMTQKPVVALLAPKVICEGEKFDIINDVADKNKYTYEWYFNGNEPIAGNSYEILDNTKKGSYKVIATYIDQSSYNKQCKVEETVTVDSPNKPVVALTDEAICGGTSYDLSKKFDQSSVPGLTTHDWYQVIDPSNSIKLSNLNVNTTATYDLRISVDALGISCNYSYPMNLNVVALPVLPVDHKYVICSGDTAQLDAKGDYLSYSWAYHGLNASGPIVSSNFPNEKIVEATKAGYYKVKAWTQDGALACSNVSDSIYLTVNNLPLLTIVPDKTYLCENGTVEMTVSNASGLSTTYKWTNGGNSNIIGVSQTGYYGVAGTDINGCTATTGHNVIDYTPTDIVLPTFPAICYGDSVVLPAIPGVNSFQWFYGSVNNSEQGLINQPWKVGKDGVYVVSYTTEAQPDGCPIEKSLTLTVMPLPTFNVVAPTQLLCDGDSFTLDAGADYPMYKWTLKGANGVADQVVGLDRTYTGTVSGNYMLQAWTSGGCTDSTLVNVVVNTNPAVSVGADFDACVGVDFTLTLANASNLTGIVWSTGVKDVPSITTNQPGLYTVTAYDGTGCYSVDSIKVGNLPVTVIEFPQVAPICSNDTYTLTSPLAIPTQIQSYQWYYNTVGGLPQGLPNLPWTVNTPGNYVLEVKDLNGCFSSSVFKLATIPAPDFTLGPDRSGCYHDTLRIEAKQSYIRYEWNGNPADNKYYKEVDPAITSYSLVVEDRNGCVATSNVNFVTNPLPIVNLGNDLTTCAGPLTKLDPGGPYPSVLWSTGVTSPTLLAEAGTYQVWVTDANNCTGTDDITITWLPNPRPDLGPDELICPVEDLLVDAGDGYQKYLWHTGAVSQTIYADIVDTVNLVSVTDFNGCEGWDSKLVFKMGDPDYILSNDTVACTNETVVLDAGSEYTEFLWSNGETTQTIDVTTPGDYWVRASDGCFVVRDTANVSFWELPVVAKLDTMVYAQIVVLAEGGLRPYSYALNEGSFQSDSIFRNLQKGTYIAYVQDGNGCAASDTITLNSIYDIDIPKFFTPNGDGFNDVWEIGGLERFPDAEIIIYDRYGKQLAKFGSDPAKWDGRYLNKPMPSDDYWYVINLIHVNKTIKGNLTLKR